KAFRGLQRVEGAVDLDAGHGPGGVLEFPALHQPLGVEVTPPGRVAPAGYADMNAFHAASTQRFGAAGEGGSLAGKVSSSASSRRSSASSCAGTRLTLVQPQACRSKALKASMLSCSGATRVSTSGGSIRPLATRSTNMGMYLRRWQLPMFTVRWRLAARPMGKLRDWGADSPTSDRQAGLGGGSPG